MGRGGLVWRAPHRMTRRSRTLFTVSNFAYEQNYRVRVISSDNPLLTKSVLASSARRVLALLGWQIKLSKSGVVNHAITDPSRNVVVGWLESQRKRTAKTGHEHTKMSS